MMEAKPLTRLTLEQYENKLSWETPYNDVGADEIINAFYSLMIGATFPEKSIIDAMVDFVNEHGSEYYEVTEKESDRN